MSQENVNKAPAEDVDDKKAPLIEEVRIIKSSNEDFDFDDGRFYDIRSIKTIRSVKSFRNLINPEKDSRDTSDTIFDKLSGSISDTDTDSDTDSVGSYLAQKSLVPQPDFFDTFGDIPSLSVISYESSVHEVLAETPKVSLVDEETKSYFADPLTGERLHSEEDIPPELEPELQAAKEEVGEEEEDDEDLLLPLDIEEDEIITEKIDDDKLELWFHLQEPKVARIEEIDFEIFAHLEHERQLKELATQFLDHLIDRVVEQCTYVDPKTILRQSLDKGKLMAELQKKLVELEIEQKICYILNRKIVDHHQRKKSYRAILDDNPNTITQVMEKFKQATTALNQALEREKELRHLTDEKIQALEFEVFEEEGQSKQNISSLEDMIKKAMQVERSNQLTRIVENEFEKMAKLRREISDVRLLMIQKQHTLATLQEKMRKIDNFGDELLDMRTYDQMQTEVIALGKKNEERYGDLNKLLRCCNANVHILSHIKEKKLGLRAWINIQEQALHELLDEKKEIRDKILNSKLDQRKLRNEIHNLSYQGGLIDKPALMRDYDETVDRLLEKRPQVEQMRQKHNDLERKIALLEARCKVVKVQ